MKPFIVNIFLCLFTCLVSGQTFEWANGYGNKSFDQGQAITAEADGDNYVTGAFRDTLLFGKDTLVSLSNSASTQENLLIGKHSAKGSTLWGYAPEKLNFKGEARGNDIVEQNSFVYTTGYYTDTIIFSSNDKLYGSGKKALFLLKMDTSGKVIWAKSKDFSGINIVGKSIAVRGDNVYVAGKKGQKPWIAKYDSNGSLLWEKNSNNQTSGTATGNSISEIGIDKNENIYGIGAFSDSVVFGNFKVKNYGGFLIKFDSTGKTKWLNSFSNANLREGIAVSPSGNFWITGAFRNNFFYQGKGKIFNSNYHCFIGAFDSKGSLKWLRYGENANSGSVTFGQGISYSNKLINVIGYYSGKNAIFGKDTLQDSGLNDIFILKMNKRGQFLYSFGTGGIYLDDGNDLAFDKDGNSYFTGSFTDKTNFGDNQIISGGSNDIFVSKLSDIRIFQDTIPDTTLCAGQSLQVPFTVDGNFDPGNTFTAQLSNNTGNFDNPIPIGSIQDTVGDTIQATIPDTLSYGTGYQMRIVSDSPRVVSFDDGQTYTIYPQKVPNLKAVSKTQTDSANGQVTIKWSPVADTGNNALFRLYHKGPSDTAFSLLKDSIRAPDSQYVQGSINTKTANHRYYLTAIDSCGIESDSSGIHQTMDLRFEVGQLSHKLQWTPYQGFPVQNYLVQRRQGNRFITLDSLNASDTAITKFPEPCNVPISYRIKAIDSNGVFSFSDTATREALDTIPPNGAELSNATVISDSVVKVTFQGADSLDIFSYDIMRKQGSGNFQLTARIIFDTSGGSFTVYDTVNTESNRLCYQILTQDSCLNTVPSDTFCPVQLNGKPKNQANQLSWTPFRGYPVDSQYVLRASGNGYDTIARLGPQDTALLDDPLPCGKAQTYRVRVAEQGGSRTSLSDTIQLTPFDTAATPVPQLRYAAVNLQQEVEVGWHWQTDSDQKFFEVWRANGNGNFRLLDTVIYDSTYTDTTAGPRKNEHQYYVVAIDSCKTGRRSAPSDTDRLMVPQATTGACRPENVLSWNAYDDLPQGVDKYEIYRKEQQGTSNPFNLLTTNNQQQTTYIDTNLTDTITYCYRIKAVDTQSGYAAWSDSICKEPFDYPVPDTSEVIRSTVTKTGKTNGAVKVFWQRYPKNDTFARGYEIYHTTGQKPQNFQLIANISNLSDTTFTHKGINTSDDVHNYRVLVYNLCKDQGGFFNTHQPVNLEATALNPDIQLNWYPYRGFPVERYEVQRSVDGGAFNTIATTQPSDTALLDQNVECGRQYAYKVFAYGRKAQQVSVSDTVIRVGKDPVKPTPPVLKSASVSKTGPSNGTVNITWNRSTSKDAARYTIYRSQNGQDYQFLDTVVGTSYTDQGLNTYNQPYHYRLIAIDSCDNLSDSFSTPHRTINLEANGSEEAVILSWNAYKGRTVSQYQVIRGSEVLYTVSGEQTFLRDEKVICDTSYNYQVRALMEGDTSIRALSNTDSAKATDNTPPNPIYLQRASVTSFNDVVELKWQASEAYDAQAYQIYRRNENTGDFNQIAEVKHPNTTYQDSFPINNRELCYLVKVKDACNNTSEFSNRGCIIQPEGEALDFENELSWPPYEKWQKGTRTYEVFKQTGDSTYQSLVRLDSSQRSYLDQDLRDSADQFCYYIRAEGFGEETYSRSTKICLEQSAIVHIPNTFSPGVTPNLNDQFGPEGLYIANYEMQIYNRWGEQVFSTSTSERWDGSYGGELVPQGVYHYQIVVRSEDGSRETYSGELTVVR